MEIVGILCVFCIPGLLRSGKSGNCWNTGGFRHSRVAEKWTKVEIVGILGVFVTPGLLRSGKMKIVGILVVYGNMLE